jgi:hypothetical protein
MHLAVLPFSLTDLGWFCLAAAILLSAITVLWVLLVTPVPARRMRARADMTSTEPVPRERISSAS